jgi:hypothetical protein
MSSKRFSGLLVLTFYDMFLYFILDCDTWQIPWILERLCFDTGETFEAYWLRDAPPV